MGLAKKAIELDDTLGESYSLLGSIQLLLRNYDAAIRYGRLAVERQPNGAEVNALLAQTLNFAGQPGEALVAVKRAIRLSPTHPAYYDFHLGLAYYLLDRYPEALLVLNGYRKRMPEGTETPIFLISIHLSQGNRKEALRLAKELRNSKPSMPIPVYISRLMPLRDEGLRKRLIREMASMGFRAAP
jgi:adenylate cyclase